MPDSFKQSFEQLTGNKPFPWQEALYGLFSSGAFPSSCNIPTGLGKTSVLAIWLIAQSRFPNLIPRRLVYVVNRRTVVDQTTTEAENLKKNAKFAGCTEPAISTLRGQFADNREWSADPSKPAIICGTVDMIGSRLLFNGYGIGFKSKPLHAGFLGQDVLLVHDESHLEPAFQQLLISIEKEQQISKEFAKFRVMELTATSRAQDAFTLSKEDRSVGEVNKRINAPKTICLHAEPDPKKFADRVAELALKHKDSKKPVLVYVRTVENVMKVCEKLTKEKQNVEKLTGTLRGKERDELVNRPNFKRFLPKQKDGVAEPTQSDKTVFLVCTSAGEVGINISADHLVCDLSTFDSMAQRFGRVNRFGNCLDTIIDIVHPLAFDSKKEFEVRCGRTLELLKALGGNGNPAALDTLDSKDRIFAFSPPPAILPVTDILFDAWALTTIKGKLPGRPPVAPYLNGISGWQPPEIHVAWREEVGRITSDLVETYIPQDLLDDFPLKPHELLREPNYRAFKQFGLMAKRRPKDLVWLLDDDGTIEILTLEQIADKDKKNRIDGKTVILDPSTGGLNGGHLDGNSETADDVSNTKDRLRIWNDDPSFKDKTKGMRLIQKIRFLPPSNDEDIEGKSWCWFEIDNEGAKTSKKPVSWYVHVKDVVEHTATIVGNLLLETTLKNAIIFAAKYHDHGKLRHRFQVMLNNRNYPRLVLAKSGKKSGSISENYRHEFGSLIDVQAEPDFLVLDVDMQQLVLHLIATHHGRARPHFPLGEDFDPERNQVVADNVVVSVPRRFAILQRKYGRWGLAYLESLLRAGDWVASAKPSAFIEETE